MRYLGDWTGNGNSIYKTLGASNHTEKEREENDYYATDPNAIDLLFEVEDFDNIWECACGEGHLSKRMIELGKTVYSTDIIDRGYGDGQIDFLSDDVISWHGDIITNPLYKYAIDFVYKSLDIMEDNNKLALFLKVQFLEGKKRKLLFEKYPPKVIYISSSRILCAKNGDFEMMKKNGGSAVAYAWFIWEKGYDGETIIKWIN